MKTAIILALVVLGGCAAKPSAESVCKRFEAEGIAKPGSCKQVSPAMLSARAKEKYDLELVSVPGKSAGVMTFENAEAYDATVKAFEGAAMLAGPHRYGNASKLVFVQMNDGASVDVGKKSKAIVDAL